MTIDIPRSSRPSRSDEKILHEIPVALHRLAAGDPAGETCPELPFPIPRELSAEITQAITELSQEWGL